MKFLTIALTLLTSLSVFAGAEFKQTVQKMEASTKEASSDLGRSVKRTGRKVSDETCEMVHGKMDCAVKKTKHTIQNGADNVEDSVD